MFLIYVTGTEDKSDNDEWIQLPLTSKKLHKVFLSLIDKYGTGSGYTVTKILTNFGWLDINIGDFGTPDFFNIYALNNFIKRINKLGEEDIVKFKKHIDEGFSIFGSLDLAEPKKKRMNYKTITYTKCNNEYHLNNGIENERWKGEY